MRGKDPNSVIMVVTDKIMRVPIRHVVRLHVCTLGGECRRNAWADFRAIDFHSVRHLYGTIPVPPSLHYLSVAGPRNRNIQIYFKTP